MILRSDYNMLKRMVHLFFCIMLLIQRKALSQKLSENTADLKGGSGGKPGRESGTIDEFHDEVVFIACVELWTNAYAIDIPENTAFKVKAARGTCRLINFDRDVFLRAIFEEYSFIHQTSFSFIIV